MNTHAHPIQLDNQSLESLLPQVTAGTLELIDVRTPEEYCYLGHIPGATLIPLHELPQRWTHLDKTKSTILVCEHGVRSMDASYYLIQQGFQRISNLTHGMADWQGPREFSEFKKKDTTHEQ